MCEEYLTNARFPQYPLFSELNVQNERERSRDLESGKTSKLFGSAYARKCVIIHQQKICLSGAWSMRQT